MYWIISEFLVETENQRIWGMHDIREEMCPTHKKFLEIGGRLPPERAGNFLEIILKERGGEIKANYSNQHEEMFNEDAAFKKKLSNFSLASFKFTFIDKYIK
jgi:hypothetical protein